MEQGEEKLAEFTDGESGKSFPTVRRLLLAQPQVHTGSPDAL